MKITLLSKTLGLFGLLAFATSAQAGPLVPIDNAVAPADDLGMTISVGYDSSYVFRGFEVGQNQIWGEVDKSIDLSDNLTLDLGVWYGSLADQDYDELDLISGLTYDLGVVKLGLGYIWYLFPRTGGDTGELLASVSTSVGIVDLGVGYFYDYDLLNGHYIELSASTSIAITDRISLEPGVTVAYEVGYNSSADGFSNVGLALALPIKLTDSVTLAPYVSARLPLDVLDDIAGQDDDLLYGGVSLSVDF